MADATYVRGAHDRRIVLQAAKDAAILEIQLLNESRANGWTAPGPEDYADRPAAQPTEHTKGTA